MRIFPAFFYIFFLLFTLNTVYAIPDSTEFFNPELTDTGNIPQTEMKIIDPVWQTGQYAEAYIYLAGYRGEITIESNHYIPKAPSECAIVYVNTNNIANRPAGQSYTTKLTDGEDGTLEVELNVKTSYQVKKYKTILGARIPYYVTKTAMETFYQSFYAPPVLPAVEPPKAYVTYYNGSHAIVNVGYVDEDGKEIDGIGRVDVKIPGSSAREYRLIGEVITAENGFRSTVFKKISTWKYTGKQMSRSPKGLYISEPFDINSLEITVSTPYVKNMQVTDIEYTVIEDTSRKFWNIAYLVLFVYIVLFCRPFYLRILREVEKCKLKY